MNRLSPILILIASLCAMSLNAQSAGQDANAYFATVRTDPVKLRAFLRMFPKGAELHTHLSGTPTPDRLLSLATEAKRQNYFVSIPDRAEPTDDPTAYALTAFAPGVQPPANSKMKLISPTALLNAKTADLKAHLAEFRQANLINSKDSKPLAAFYSTTFQRRGAVVNNKELIPSMIVSEMKQARRHRVSYLEIQVNPFPSDPTLKGPDNERSMNPTTAREFMKRLIDTVNAENKKVKEDKQVDVRFILAFLRTSPRIFSQLPIAFDIASSNDTVGQSIAAINLVGNEYADDGKIGQQIAPPEYSKEYLLTLKKTYPRVRLTLHAGETTKWDRHIHDSILAGAERIGHAINLEQSPDNSDADTMKNNKIAIEACPTSNYILFGVPYAKHPFVKYLRAGIPTTISTDDAGIFETDLTEEFARVAEAMPDLTWDEIKSLARNSLEYSFATDARKKELIAKWASDLRVFEEPRANWTEFLRKE